MSEIKRITELAIISIGCLIQEGGAMDYEHLIYTKEEGIATITLNRPQKLNAFNIRMYQGIKGCLR